MSHIKFKISVLQEQKKKPADKLEHSAPQTRHLEQLLEELLCKLRGKTLTHQREKLTFKEKISRRITTTIKHKRTHQPY